VEVAISIQLVRRAVFSKKQSILRRFQRSNRGTLLKLTKMVMLLWMNGQSACIVYQSLAAWSCNLELGQDMEWSLHQNVRSQILSQLELDFCMQFETLPYCMGLSFCPSHNQVTWKLSKVKINPTSFGATHIHITLRDDVSSTQVSTFWVEFLPLQIGVDDPLLELCLTCMHIRRHNRLCNGFSAFSGWLILRSYHF